MSQEEKDSNVVETTHDGKTLEDVRKELLSQLRQIHDNKKKEENIPLRSFLDRNEKTSQELNKILPEIGKQLYDTDLSNDFIEEMEKPLESIIQELRGAFSEFDVTKRLPILDNTLESLKNYLVYLRSEIDKKKSEKVDNLDTDPSIKESKEIKSADEEIKDMMDKESEIGSYEKDPSLDKKKSAKNDKSLDHDKLYLCTFYLDNFSQFNELKEVVEKIVVHPEKISGLIDEKEVEKIIKEKSERDGNYPLTESEINHIIKHFDDKADHFKYICLGFVSEYFYNNYKELGYYEAFGLTPFMFGAVINNKTINKEGLLLLTVDENGKVADEAMQTLNVIKSNDNYDIIKLNKKLGLTEEEKKEAEEVREAVENSEPSEEGRQVEEAIQKREEGNEPSPEETKQEVKVLDNKLNEIEAKFNQKLKVDYAKKEYKNINAWIEDIIKILGETDSNQTFKINDSMKNVLEFISKFKKIVEGINNEYLTKKNHFFNRGAFSGQSDEIKQLASKFPVVNDFIKETNYFLKVMDEMNEEYKDKKISDVNLGKFKESFTLLSNSFNSFMHNEARLHGFLKNELPKHMKKEIKDNLEFYYNYFNIGLKKLFIFEKYFSKEYDGLIRRLNLKYQVGIRLCNEAHSDIYTHSGSDNYRRKLDETYKDVKIIEAGLNEQIELISKNANNPTYSNLITELKKYEQELGNKASLKFG